MGAETATIRGCHWHLVVGGQGAADSAQERPLQAPGRQGSAQGVAGPCLQEAGQQGAGSESSLESMPTRPPPAVAEPALRPSRGGTRAVVFFLTLLR